MLRPGMDKSEVSTSGAADPGTKVPSSGFAVVADLGAFDFTATALILGLMTSLLSWARQHKAATHSWHLWPHRQLSGYLLQGYLNVNPM